MDATTIAFDHGQTGCFADCSGHGDDLASFMEGDQGLVRGDTLLEQGTTGAEDGCTAFSNDTTVNGRSKASTA
jgi:hypothetical protein